MVRKYYYSDKDKGKKSFTDKLENNTKSTIEYIILHVVSKKKLVLRSRMITRL